MTLESCIDEVASQLAFLRRCATRPLGSGHVDGVGMAKQLLVEGLR